MLLSVFTMDSVLLNFTLENNETYSGEDELCTLLLEKKYETIIRTTSLKPPENDDLVTWIKETVGASSRPETLQIYGISCLQLFVELNWVGGGSLPDEASLFPWIRPETKTIFLEYLVGDGDSSVTVAKHQVLLALALLILTECRTLLPGVVSDLWCVRCALTVQSILEERSQTIFSLLTSVFKELETSNVPVKLKPIQFLEEARFHYSYFDVREASRCTELAAGCTGLKIDDTGALGRRTKYQTKDLPQFTIDLEITGTYEKRSDSVDPKFLPTDLKLDDDVRLEKIAFADQSRNLNHSLDELQQAVVLSRYFLKQRNLPADDLTAEEIMPHLSVILENPVAWSNHVTALFNRCKLETRSGRTIERARAQLETLLESYQADTPAAVRMQNIYLSRLPPRWEVEKELGSILLSLGSTKAALDLYLKLESWDEVIVCYNILEKRHKSAEVIKRQLEVKETGRLWCQLGDATDDLQCYHKALEITNNKSARAFKSLGLHHYFRKDYETGIDYFQKSLQCSRFQLDVLLRLGFSALEIEKYDVAAQAYRDYCSLESDNFEAWNNLAKCYTMLKQKERAWRVLQEAVRCDYDNWKVWDNILVLSTDLGAFDESIRAYNRILDIKQTHEDEEILNIITHAVVKGLPNSSGRMI